MRRAKLVIIAVVALSLLCFFTIPTAFAQPLDGLWFRLNGRFLGYEVNPGTGAALRGRGARVAYLGFVTDGGAGYYYAVYTEQAPGVWLISYAGNYTPPAFDYFFPDWYWTLSGEGTSFATFYHTAAITPAFRGWRYQGWGEVVNGDDGEGNVLLGGVTIRGRSVDPSSLPFTPIIPVP